MDQTIKSLNEFLADLNVFYRKLQNYHWNITGEHFFVLHEKLEEYYDDINDQIDEIAEHILMMGHEPMGTLKGYIETSKIEEAKDEKVKSDVVLKSVVEGFTLLKNKSIEIKKLADENQLFETSTMMDDYMSDYSKKLWMLNQSMQ